MSKTKTKKIDAETAAEIAAQDAELEASGREYARTWAVYEEARTRLMRSLLHEYGSAAAGFRVEHDDLTDAERERIVADRKVAAQEAWGDFQSAEVRYVIAVDGEVPVEFREP